MTLQEVRSGFNIGSIAPIVMDSGLDMKRGVEFEESRLSDSGFKKWQELLKKRGRFAEKERRYSEEAPNIFSSDVDLDITGTINMVGFGIRLNLYFANQRADQFATENGMLIASSVLNTEGRQFTQSMEEDMGGYSVAELMTSGDSPDNASKVLRMFTTAFNTTREISNRGTSSGEKPTVREYVSYSLTHLLFSKSGAIEFLDSLPRLTISLDTKEAVSSLKDRAAEAQTNIRNAVLDSGNQEIRGNIEEYLNDEYLGGCLLTALGLDNAYEALQYAAKVVAASEKATGEDKDFYAKLSGKLFETFTQSFGHVIESLRAQSDAVEEPVVEEPVKIAPKNKKKAELNSAGKENLVINEGNSKLLSGLGHGSRWSGFANPADNHS